MKAFSFVLVSFITAILALTLGQILKPYYDTTHQFMAGLVALFVTGMVISFVVNEFKKPLPVPKNVEEKIAD